MYSWLAVRTMRHLKPGSFELTDRLDQSPFGQRIISFKTLDRGETSALLRVGACPQWRGYPRDVYLLTGPVQDIREIRLLR